MHGSIFVVWHSMPIDKSSQMDIANQSVVLQTNKQTNTQITIREADFILSISSIDSAFSIYWSFKLDTHTNTHTPPEAVLVCLITPAAFHPDVSPTVWQTDGHLQRHVLVSLCIPRRKDASVLIGWVQQLFTSIPLRSRLYILPPVTQYSRCRFRQLVHNICFWSKTLRLYWMSLNIK